MKTVDSGVQYRADEANRVAVTAQWLWEHPDTQAYIFETGADDVGLDPWITIVGVDALTDGSKIILEVGRTGERIVDPDEFVFVQHRPGPLPRARAAMNEARRKQISEAVAKIEEAKSILETCRDEEQDYYDNMPENMQGGEKGQKAEEAASTLDEALNELENIIGNLEGATE